MDYYTILSQKKNLNDKLIGEVVESARISENKFLFLGFGCETGLKLACLPDMPYLHEVEKRYLPFKTSQDWHHKRLQGQTVNKIDMVKHDRILKIKFKSGLVLIFEMTGRNTNIILADDDGIILGSMRTVTARESAFRVIMPGAKYVLPPERSFPDLTVSPDNIHKSHLMHEPGKIVDVLASSFCCGSRLFAGESLKRAGIDPGADTSELSGSDADRLLGVMGALEKEIAGGGDGAVVITGADGVPENVFPLKIEVPNKTAIAFDDLNEAMYKYARNREVELEKRSLKNFVLGCITRDEKKIRATIKKVESEAGDDSQPEVLEHIANTILANLHKIKKGTKEITLPDVYGSGDIDITLDPSLEGPANAAKFFTRARKLRAASKLAVERLESLSARLETLGKEREIAVELDDLKQLRELSASYARYQGSAKEIPQDEKFPRRFRSVSGLEIIVGRSDEENDALVRWAGRNDYWLHAQGVGGSHVILKSPGKQAPDHRSVEQAAAIAAYYSKAKTSAVVPVAVTLVKYVIKRKGQGPGKVTYTREKVVFVEPGIPSGENDS